MGYCDEKESQLDSFLRKTNVYSDEHKGQPESTGGNENDFKISAARDFKVKTGKPHGAYS